MPSKKALVRRPSPRLAEGLVTHVERTEVDVDLEKLGFAERRPSPDDRRSRIVELTEDGRSFLRDTDEAGQRVSDELVEPLDAAERETLHVLLQKIAEAGLG